MYPAGRQLCPKQWSRFTFFQLHRGVRQGCPLSGLLFVLGIEFFARALKSNNDIKGIAVGGWENVTQFADDITLFVSDHQSAINLLKVLREFKHLPSILGRIKIVKTLGSSKL